MKSLIPILFTAFSITQAYAEVPWGLAAIHAPEVWQQSNFGKGARVLIVDTGIDPNHPALKGRFEEGRNFTNEEDQDFRGHGTHQAGVAVGESQPNGFSGVAPQATLLTAKVMDGSKVSSPVADAVLWGIEKKVDVISMAFSKEKLDSALVIALMQAELAGIVVVATVETSGFPKQALLESPGVIGVGALNQSLDAVAQAEGVTIAAPGQNIFSSLPIGSAQSSEFKVVLGGQEEIIPSVGLQGSPPLPQAIPGGLVLWQSMSSSEMAGKIVVFQRDGTPFVEMAQKAAEVGAAGVVIVSVDEVLMEGRMADSSDRVVYSGIPVVMISKSAGERLSKAISMETEQLKASLRTWRGDYGYAEPMVSAATAYVTGVVALMKSANPKATPEQIRRAIYDTARPLNSRGYGTAGLIDAAEAVKAIGKAL